MAKGHYLPKTEGARITWLDNVALKAPNYTGIIAALDVAACAALTDDAAYYAAVVQMSDNVNDFKEAVNQHKTTLTRAPRGTTLSAFPIIAVAVPTPVPAGIFTRIADLIKQIKGDPNYTEAIGQDLGIVGDEDTFDISAARPELKLSFSANIVTIKFNKPRQATGIKLFSRRAGEADFAFLALDTASPYNDTRSNLTPGTPEKREYKAWFFVDDAIVGLESDIVNIVVNIS